MWWETNNALITVLLDWGKAFDKVEREGMFLAMDRMGIDDKLIRLIKVMYKETEFNVKIDGETLRWKGQSTGIGHGCPLSPYLFLMVVTVIFYDVHEKLGKSMIEGRVPGTEFDEVVYADDTIWISTKTQEMNRMLAEKEETGESIWAKIK